MEGDYDGSLIMRAGKLDRGGYGGHRREWILEEELVELVQLIIE